MHIGSDDDDDDDDDDDIASDDNSLDLFTDLIQIYIYTHSTCIRIRMFIYTCMCTSDCSLLIPAASSSCG